MTEIPKDPERRAAYEACVLVAPHFQLDPLSLLGPTTRHAAVGARRVAWLVLAEVYGWNPNRISDATAWSRQAVANGLEVVRKAKKGTALAKIRDACLAEAAGAGT